MNKPDPGRASPPEIPAGSPPRLTFGFRGEDITYSVGGRTAEVGFTYIRGPRIYTDTIREWDDGTRLTPAERRDVLQRCITLVRKARERPTIVINADDPLAAEWRAMCEEFSADIDHVETTSDADTRAFQKKMFMDILAAGKGVTVDGVPLRTEEEIDRYVERAYPVRGSTNEP